MKNKTNKKVNYLYYFGIGIIGILFLISGFLEVTKNPATYPKTLSMGYPPYFITTLGFAKIIGVIALWLPYFNRLKEWVFAGFTFDVIFAFISGLQINSVADYVKASIALIFIMLIYALFRIVHQPGEQRVLSNTH
ncbi:MAG: DoxX family protein [Bacteroidota bacterium]|nr:DoxX family protein [Bacteroidota bacterium]MDP4216330.1 DoxX family protein [Bacteroidota bacterium]MDP4247507.1 DoxX family protein [Bacteroidota bacterium]MDP4255059.1 DoxX family protein [Bacteroidota bacterium]MDP4257181.1 DoxX family protein [Bacteroidota bacterium]